MKVSIFDVVIIAESSSYAYLSIVKNPLILAYCDKNVINKHLSTPLIIGKTSLDENYHYCADF